MQPHALSAVVPNVVSTRTRAFSHPLPPGIAARAASGWFGGMRVDRRWPRTAHGATNDKEEPCRPPTLIPP